MLTSFDSPLEVDRPKDRETTGMQRPCVAVSLDCNIPHVFYAGTWPEPADKKRIIREKPLCPITPFAR